jgi:DNA-binding transcriptional regulator YiaG
MKKQYADDFWECIHESAQSLFRLGVIDAAEMKEFDEECLTPEPKPKETAVPARTPRPAPAYAKPAT